MQTVFIRARRNMYSPEIGVVPRSSESLARKDFSFRVVHEHHEFVRISGIVDRHLEEIDHAVDVREACHFLLLRFSALYMSVFRDTIVSSC